ncbi:MAG: hybrid sensor histidine kinase/response regulator [Burkholderiaceae bacterium]
MRLAYRSSIGERSSQLDLSIAAQSVGIRASQSVHSGPIVLAGATLCGVAFAIAGGGWLSLLGALIIVAGAVINRQICQRILERGEISEPGALAQVEETMWWLTVMNTVSVGIWIWLVGTGSSQTELLFVVTMVQSMYSLGALINASTHPPTFITGTWLNFGLMIAFWLTQGASGVAAAVALVGLGLLLGKFSRQIHKDFSKSVEMRFENASLLERLQKQVQIADTARASAEEANQSKSKFLAAASHDLRQPLHSLMLFTGLLEGANATQRTEYMQQIRGAADSLDALFTGLLDLNKLDAGDGAVDLLNVDLGKLLTPIAKEFRAVAEKKQLELHWHLPDCKLKTDPYLLERIVRNLLDNAIKYTDSGQVMMTLKVDSDQALLDITDTGPGIPLDQQKEIFSEFHRVADESSAAVSGSGLGLAIVTRLCEKLGYQISVNSTVGQGSRFTLSMPFPENHHLSIREAEPVKDTGWIGQLPTQATVIVIEDNDTIRHATASTIELMGARSMAFESGEALRDAMQAGRVGVPNAIVADFRLPGALDGIETIMYLRREFSDVPAAIISGELHTLPTEKALPPNVSFFRKPVSQTVLVAWLKDALH